MSEFGNDAASTALKVEMEAIKMLGKFLQYLINASERKVNAELKKEQLNELKQESIERAVQKKLANKSGYVRGKLLQKSGEPLVPINLRVNDKHMRRFAALAKKYGILFTSISDRRVDGKKDHILLVKEKDLEKCKHITERMMDEFKLQGIEKDITELEEKEYLSESETKDLDFLKNKKEQIISNDLRKFNLNNADIIFSDICEQMQDQSLSFDEALNHFTDRDYSREKPYYLCERTNPDSYIELRSSRDTFCGEVYTRTEYKVFRDGKEQKSSRADGVFTDERFEGRPRDYWKKLKKEMKQKGEYTDDVVVFKSKAEFERYRQIYWQQQDKNISEMQQTTEHKNYDSIKEKLEKWLNENGMELSKNGIVQDKETKQPLQLNSGMSIEDKAKTAESVIVGEQIKNCSQIERDRVSLAMDEQQLINLDPKSFSYQNLENQIQETKQKIKEDLQVESELLKKRNRINGVQAALKVDMEYSEKNGHLEEIIKQKELDNKANHSLEEWKGKIGEHREQAAGDSHSVNWSVRKSMPKSGVGKVDR